MTALKRRKKEQSTENQPTKEQSIKANLNSIQTDSWAGIGNNPSKKRFNQINKLMAFDRDINGCHKFILALHSFDMGKGRAYPSQITLMKICGVKTNRTIWQYKTKLEAAGWLYIQSPDRRKKAKIKTTMYYWNHPIISSFDELVRRFPLNKLIGIGRDKNGKIQRHYKDYFKDMLTMPRKDIDLFFDCVLAEIDQHNEIFRIKFDPDEEDFDDDIMESLNKIEIKALDNYKTYKEKG